MPDGPFQNDTDADLLKGAAAGDQAAWNQLVDRYGRLVYHSARAVGADPDLATDVSQIVWMRLLSRLDTIRDPEKIKGWLAIVARNTARSELTKRRPTPVIDDLLQSMDLPEREPENVILAEEEDSAIRRAFRRLGEACRELLTLLFAAELSYAEIAATLGRPLGWIGPTRGRCLAALTAELRKLEAA
ncbi:RNA polymerase sigma factor [Euzebya tangerina]|uniref:RNA polymerase sigma factor n=1 Tax=Euzebya tangerina TaxID=591198 RepID=UPI0013C329F6|nr:sigma-70 family RNA polymerase sigma factor [Euzebya tangerina]